MATASSSPQRLLLLIYTSSIMVHAGNRMSQRRRTQSRLPSPTPTTEELHSRYDMFKTIKKIYVKPSTLSPGEALAIDRATEEIDLEYLNKIPTPSKRIPIIGVMGIVKMITCKYLIVIEEKSRVGPDPGAFPYFLSNTWRIDKVNMVAVAPGKTRLTHRMARANDRYLLAMLEILNSKNLYFSYDIDLSHTLQRIADLQTQDGEEGIFARVKKMFIWNYPILIPFLKVHSAANYVVPVVNGFVSTRTLSVSNVSLHLSVISRRRRSRSGKRYFSRGINRKGYCSNVVETEMVIEVRKNRVGFVMTRGSYPFYWMQWPDLSLQPKPRILYQETSDEAFDLHMKEMIEMYGRMYIFDLESQHDDPKVGKEFSNFLSKCVEGSEFSNRITVETIDLFTLNWADEDLHSIEVYGALREMLMTVATKTGIQQRQKGVFHICSLDGTDLADVLQFSLAKLALVSAVLYFELSTIAHRLATQKDHVVNRLTSELAALWSEQSDALAMYYVGTESLGSDFYKTTLLSKKHTWRDIQLKMKRWYANNFSDAVYQDCLEVCTKNMNMDQTVLDPCKLNLKCRLEQRLKCFLCSMVPPSLALFCLLHLLVLGLQHSDRYCIGGWILMSLISLAVLFNSVSFFVDVPKSVKKPNIRRTAMDWSFLPEEKGIKAYELAPTENSSEKAWRKGGCWTLKSVHYKPLVTGPAYHNAGSRNKPP